VWGCCYTRESDYSNHISMTFSSYTQPPPPSLALRSPVIVFSFDTTWYENLNVIAKTIKTISPIKQQCYLLYQMSDNLIIFKAKMLGLYLFLHFQAQNRPYRLFTFHPMASFSCQILTHVFCLVRLKITLLLSLRTARNKFVQENMGI
jgi:hypothetical protein